VTVEAAPRVDRGRPARTTGVEPEGPEARHREVPAAGTVRPRAGVLIVGNFQSSPSGTHSVCDDLAGRLAAADWTVLTTSRETRRLRRLADMLLTVWRERRAYGVAQVDVFSGPAFVWAECACGLLRLLGKPYVLTLHGGNLPSFARRWPGRVRALLGKAAAVTTPSGYLRSALSSARPDIRLIPNSLDAGAYAFRLRERPAPRLVWLRSFHRIYNPRLAVDAVEHLRREFPAVELVMIGPDRGDGALAELRSGIARLGLESRVHLLDAVPKREVPRWLQCGDIFLNTAEIDNTPVTLLEAMACGLCGVSTKVGGIPYLVEEGRDGLLVPAGDAVGLAAAVRRVLTEPGLAPRLSRNARVKAEQFDWGTVLPEWQRLLGRVAQGRT
jgi:glycosyltransferase involved in cell wall biosynthesis